MADSINKILSGGFAGLGEVFGEAVAPVFNSFQNSKSPVPRPVNDNNFSFNFAGAVQKLLQPFQKVTDPAAAAKTDVVNALGSGLAGIISAGSNKAIDLIKNANTRPTEVTTTGLNVQNALPSQNTGGASLGDILSFLNLNRPATPSLTTTQGVAQAASNAAVANVALVGAAAILLVLLLQKGR